MEKIILIIGLFLLNFVLFAQNNQGKADDAGRIALASIVSNQIEGLTPRAQSNLQNKLNRIVTNNGMGGSSLNNRFIITANVVVLTKDITATAPPMHAYTLEVTLYIGDGIEGTLFSSTSVTLKGVGKTETKAYMAALKNLKVADPKYQSFIEQGKNKIIEYYNSKCDFILKEAEMLAGQNEFDGAISKLVGIPDLCKECYDKAMDQSTEVYRAKMENECQENISQAKAAISRNDYDEASRYIGGYTPDLKCYPEVESMLTEIKDHRCAENLGKAKGAWANRNSSKASLYLSNIPTDSKCAGEANELRNEIASKLDADDKREWEQMQKDKADAVDIRKASIEAMRQIGVAYGNNQPQNVTYNYKGWW